jgi:TusA-related sulfurtransferase
MDRRLDLRGTIRPISLLKLTEAFREMAAGETMEILVGDPDTRKDLFKVLQDSAYKLIENTEEALFYRILLEKGGLEETAGKLP